MENSDQIFYRAEQLPIFQNAMFASATAARHCAKGDVLLVQDRTSGLIYNQAFDPQLIHYDADYQNEQAISPVFERHLQQVAALIAPCFQGKSLLEVGCGKGYFLEYLQAAGFNITGFDPTYQGNNPKVIKANFSAETSIQADGIILRHVLEHVPQPLDFLRQIQAANDHKGRIYIEVPCFDWICRQRAWFDIYYEHVNYFRLTDLCRMFAQVYDCGHLFGGQYLYIIADLASLRLPQYHPGDKLDFPPDFLGTVHRYALQLQSQKHLDKTRHSVIWGAASKGVIFALYMQRCGATIDYVIDINPAKQGKYLAATGLLVNAPQTVLNRIGHNSNIYVMNHNYLAEIKHMTNHQFNYFSVDGGQ